MTSKKTPLVTPEVAVKEPTPVIEKQKILKDSFVEKELLNASMIQKELMLTIRELNNQIGILNTTLNLIKEHEFVEFHRSKWRIVAYNIFLGILFAIGTVIGLALISWSTYTFFKDNEILRQIVEKQLNSRNFNFSEIRERATKDAGKVWGPTIEVEETNTTGATVLTGSTTNSNTGTKRQIVPVPMSTASGEIVILPK